MEKLYMPRYHSAELKAKEALERLKELQGNVTLEADDSETESHQEAQSSNS